MNPVPKIVFLIAANDRASYWPTLEAALIPAARQGLMAFENLPQPTEAALRQVLDQGGVDILHLLTRCSANPAARYATLTLVDSKGQSRNVTARFLGGILAGTPSVRLLTLQATPDSTDSLDTVAAILQETGAPVVLALPALDARIGAEVCRTLYRALATGSSLNAATALVRDVLVRAGQTDLSQQLIVHAKDPDASFAPGITVPETLIVDTPVSQPVALPAAAADLQQRAARQEIERKQAIGAFDVFLCHNSADKPAVKQIAKLLMEYGILPWLDEWELPPGQPWQPLLERQIAQIGSAAVFVGHNGVGPWQEQELYSFLREFVRRHSPVIPVLLTDAPDQPDLPIFLRGITWVDFRLNDPDPLQQLIWGVTGKRDRS